MHAKKAEKIKFGEGTMANNNSGATMITTKVKKVILAVLLIVTNGLQFILLMFIGHLGDQLALSGASTTTSFTSVTAFSFLVWMTFLPSFLSTLHIYIML